MADDVAVEAGSKLSDSLSHWKLEQMPPPLAGPADATAPPDDAPSGAGPGAVPSGGAGGLPDQGQGMLPPTSAPAPQNVGPAGNEALGQQLMRNITGAMHYARMFFAPHSEDVKLIDSVFHRLSKKYAPDSGTMRGGTMPAASQVAQPQGPGPGGPPLGGMGGAAGGPPSPPRGPIPMAAGGTRGGPPG